MMKPCPSETQSNMNMDEARPTSDADAMAMIDMHRIGNDATDAKHRAYHGAMVASQATAKNRGQI